MFINPAECLKNLFETTPGEYMLLRDFGLDNPDRVGPLSRREIREQTSRFYPVLTVKIYRQGTGYRVEALNK